MPVSPLLVIAIDFTAFAPLVIAMGFSPVAIHSLSRGLRILSCYALRMTRRLGIANTYGMRLHFRLPVIAIEFTAFAPLVIASDVASAAVKSCLRSKRKQLLGTARVSKPHGNPFPHTPCHCEGLQPRGNPFSFKGITDSFVLRTQNDAPFRHCEYLRRAVILSFTRHCERARQSVSPRQSAPCALT